LRGKTIGLTFKPNTDGMREAPSIPLITGLLDMGARVRAFDSAGMQQAKIVLPDISYCESPYSCADGADAMGAVPSSGSR
jgi:UDPglucose 6-dehydrogenase